MIDSISVCVCVCVHVRVVKRAIRTLQFGVKMIWCGTPLQSWKANFYGSTVNDKILLLTLNHFDTLDTVKTLQFWYSLIIC